MLDHLRDNHRLKCFFDVGANTGEWTAHILKRFPEARLHAFELSPITFSTLTSNVNDDRVRLNNFGLSSEVSTIELFHNLDHPELSSVYRGAGLNRIHTNIEPIVGHIRTGDDYCEEHGIQEIDYLKVDTEGHDLFVLRGFRKILDRGGIRFIQFEYNQCAISARTYLRDFYDLLGENYVIHRITTQGPVAEDYGMFSENFLYSNFLAIRRK